MRGRALLIVLIGSFTQHIRRCGSADAAGVHAGSKSSSTCRESPMWVCQLASAFFGRPRGRVRGALAGRTNRPPTATRRARNCVLRPRLRFVRIIRIVLANTRSCRGQPALEIHVQRRLPQPSLCPVRPCAQPPKDFHLHGTAKEMAGDEPRPSRRKIVWLSDQACWIADSSQLPPRARMKVQISTASSGPPCTTRPPSRSTVWSRSE